MYGAHPNLHDYGDIGAVNANTDITAAQYKRLAADAAGCAMTTPLALIGLRNTGSALFVDYVSCLWAPLLKTFYAAATPPSAVYPTGAMLTSTSGRVVLPATAADEFGVSSSVIMFAVFALNPSVFITTNWDNGFVFDGLGDGVSSAVMVF